MANVKDALGEAVNEHGVVGTIPQKSIEHSDAVDGVHPGLCCRLYCISCMYVRI